MGQQVINPERQEKKRIMKSVGIKSGKKYRKWLKGKIKKIGKGVKEK